MTNRPNRKDLVSWNRHVYSEIYLMLNEIEKVRDKDPKAYPPEDLLGLIYKNFVNLSGEYLHYCDVL